MSAGPEKHVDPCQDCNGWQKYCPVMRGDIRRVEAEVSSCALHSLRCDFCPHFGEECPRSKAAKEQTAGL